MKKYLVASTAILTAVLAMPAQAELNLDLGGHFRGYGVYADDSTAGAREFGLVRDTELHFTGEATSDNGLTVGVHYETVLGTDNVETDEAYAYFAGNWGRVNLGKEDGAAYLLQVAAPSADSNVDGLRTQIQGINTGFALDYDHADFRGAQRITYLTPKFSGFQAGVSYAADNSDNATGAGTGVVGLGVDTVGAFENLWEGSARWDGEFEGFGVSVGAGYSTAELQTATPAASPATSLTDDVQTWNAGLNVAFQGFSVGGAYVKTKADQDATSTIPGVQGGDSKVWVVGAAWDNGPYHVGASYLNGEVDFVDGTVPAAGTAEADRYTVGAGYTYGPGMSFRGAIAFGDTEIAGVEEDFTQVTVGTDIQF